MKTNVKKAVAVFSAATILMGVPCVHAEGGDISVNSAGTGVIMPRFVGITSYDSELKLNSSNVLCCYAQTTVRTPYVANNTFIQFGVQFVTPDCITNIIL